MLEVGESVDFEQLLQQTTAGTMDTFEQAIQDVHGTKAMWTWYNNLVFVVKYMRVVNLPWHALPIGRCAPKLHDVVGRLLGTHDLTWGAKHVRVSGPPFGRGCSVLCRRWQLQS